MKKAKVLSFICLFLIFALSACGSSSSSSNNDALEYAKFGETVDSAIPAGLKAGVASANIATSIEKTLQGDCASPNFTDCPYITALNGGDENAGEILMRLWSLDYHSECTEALITAGTCFECVDCGTGYNNKFYKPMMIESPTSCPTANTTTAHYVNMGVDPCFFDTSIGQISNIASCKTVSGGAVNIATAVPWYASWDIPATINFSSYYAKESTDGGGIWWTVNHGTSQQYFLSLDPNWLYLGFKDSSTNKFIFFGTGSPAYYSGRGEGNGVNISAYAGDISAIPAQFEAIQVRVQDPNKYIKRVKSNGSYLWYQSWSKTDSSFPETAADVETYKNSPTTYRCVKIGDSVVQSKYVPYSECVTSFGKASVTDLNNDDNYTLKVIDGTTASAVSFSTSLTPTVTTTSCLTETQ